MLLRRPVLERIRSGEITRVFRRWRRLTVKSGGTLQTAVGVLAIHRVERIDAADLTDEDARAAGHDGLATLLRELGSRDGKLYRIDLGWAGEDPRIHLREQPSPDAATLAELRRRLSRMDARSPSGPWTHRLLSAVADRPRVRAADLAVTLGVEKSWLKPAVRKLKSLGLTVSYEVGYELSPLGRAVLAALRRRP